jgi:hypothetical protein
MAGWLSVGCHCHVSEKRGVSRRGQVAPVVGLVVGHSDPQRLSNGHPPALFGGPFHVQLGAYEKLSPGLSSLNQNVLFSRPARAKSSLSPQSGHMWVSKTPPPPPLLLLLLLWESGICTGICAGRLGGPNPDLVEWGVPLLNLQP